MFWEGRDKRSLLRKKWSISKSEKAAVTTVDNKDILNAFQLRRAEQIRLHRGNESESIVRGINKGGRSD